MWDFYNWCTLKRLETISFSVEDAKQFLLINAFATETLNQRLHLNVYRLVRYATLVREKHDYLCWFRTVMGSMWHLQIWKYGNWMRGYISVRISLIKRVSSGPPCCFGVVRLVLSIHDMNPSYNCHTEALEKLNYRVSYSISNTDFDRSRQDCSCLLDC